MKTKLKHSYFIGLIVLLLIVFIATGIMLQLRLESILTGIGPKERSVLSISRFLTSGSIVAIFLLSYIIIRRLRRQQSLILQLEQTHANEFRFRQNLEKVSAEIHDLYNNAPCGYHSLDKDGYFQAINQTELNWLGYRREEVIGKLKFTDVLDEASAAIVETRFPQFKKNGELRELRLNMMNKLGFLIPVSLNAIAIYNEQDEYVSNRSTVFDVSEQEKTEDALKEAKRDAEQSANVKEQFLANMSHEIRTPINAVIGFTNLLQKTSLAPEQEQYVRLVQSASESLLTIINDILDISKIEAGMLRIEKSPFSLRGLCSSLETMFQPRVREKHLTLHFEIQESIPDTLTGDAVRLTQILVNLINNAIKFTHEGGIQVKIAPVQQLADTIRIRFLVQDTGIGIPTDKLDSIFERFEQGEAHTTRKYGGTGLGLSIVRNLIELQEGSINVKSEAGKGTAFIFDLPYEILPMHDNTLPGESSDAASSLNGTFEDVKILAVEDNQMNQLLMKHTFQHWNLHYELAENGQQAIDKLKMDKFDLVLLDIQMPVMDGYITARTIRHELKSNIPIIAMTAHAMAGEREKCLSHGMNDYISKPIQEKELLNLMKKYLARQKHAFENLKASMSNINIDFVYDLVMGNSAFLNNIIRQFLNQFPSEMDKLREAIEQEDKKQVASLAHHIQSTVSVFGRDTRFFRQLENLEKLATSRAGSNNLSVAFQQLDKDRQLLLMEINRLITQYTL
ncbi:PAS domain-containing hybrid sensor histidine kinase/response regulator [Paraflavitalea pollutisoli]|uniref:PAS domain-containing hybrid sensor histidine kinase/response regulator n=1 Tax=Paraflavitalea pollutisoli TaxID=3034143 RepID=UPI0023EB8628|nr:PAS domain-containing hybrid sensor histidine kinase/response regulator [Paraflavitalea sp. H1-2-19X]